jgi:hypothetical protein
MTGKTLSGPVVALAAAVIVPCGCSENAAPSARAVSYERPDTVGHALLLSMALFDENEDGSPKPLPARLGILTQRDGQWSYGWIEDPDSNVFHKAMAYHPADGPPSILTVGGTGAAVKLWDTAGHATTVWEADFGGTFSRMRDAEVGDIYGDGTAAIAVATHDQGVVAVLRPDGSGSFTVEELDRQPKTIVHEIELGDLDGDGVLEIYATPTAPNRADGSAQPGKVVRYVPAAGEGRVEVADLGYRHAKEILVTDIDGDGRQELYVAVEGVAGTKVQLRRYDADTDPAQGVTVAELPDKLCRFLTAGDVDGDGDREMVAATYRNGIWLLHPGAGEWELELIDRDSSSFEHASILLDLDGDGRDELYVASDNQKEVRRYDWTADGWDKTVLMKYDDDFGGFTWNITSAPIEMLPAVDVSPVLVAQEKPEEPRGLVVSTPRATPGYVLFAPLLSGTTYLIDGDGSVVHTWQTEFAPGASVYLLDNGHLLRTVRAWDVPVFKGGGQGGGIKEFTWEGELVWDYLLATEQQLLHHDIERLPNGNILAIAWERKSADEALGAGRQPDHVPQLGLWPDMVIELEPVPPNDARIVWEWHMWDHLIQNRDPDAPNYGDPSFYPHRIDVNGDGEQEQMNLKELDRLKALGYVPVDATREELKSDLLHTNSIAYNADLDQIALSARRFDEIWIIDHSTSTEQAAGSSGGRWGRGGDLLYRWGNPASYGRGLKADQQLFGQHDARWIPDDMPGGGNIMVFNNSMGRKKDDYSAVFEIAPPMDGDSHYLLTDDEPFGPTQPLWRYEAPDKVSFHSSFISGAHRMPNGQTLVTSGPEGRFFEVTPQGEIVWEYRSIYSGNVRTPDGSPPHPVGKATYATFRATKLAPDHPALAGRDLQPLDPQPPIVLPTDKPAE